MFRFPALPEELNVHIDKFKNAYEEQIKKEINDIIINAVSNPYYNITLDVKKTIDMYPELFGEYYDEIAHYSNIYSGEYGITFITLYLCSSKCKSTKPIFFNLTVDCFDNNYQQLVKDKIIKSGYIPDVIEILHKIILYGLKG